MLGPVRFTCALGAVAVVGCLFLTVPMAKVPGISLPPLESFRGERRLMGSRFPLGQVVDLSQGHLRMGGKAIGRLPGKVIGVGGYMHAALAKDLGFEAFRTWGGGSTPWALQAAATADALVVAGLDMKRDPQYYVGPENCKNMDQSKWWRSEADQILKVVRQNKDNPRILWWIVGNELESPHPLDQQDCVWRRVNWMANKLKEIDKKHPVGIAIAGCDPLKLSRFAAICKDVDILGMNLYGNDHWGISKTLQRAGWWKAWALTECGTAAPWQVPETSWHGLMEPMTSTRKGQFIFNGLHRCKLDDRCVGFFAFLWGWKWEKTGTWFGLLDTWTEAGGIPSGYLNDVSQPMLDEISPDWAWPMKLRIHLENVIIWSPNGTSGNPVLGFNAHQGAQVPVDLKIVATPDEAEGNIWMNWYVAPETTVNRKSDGNVPEKPMHIIPNAVFYCKNGYRGIVQTQLLKPGSYRLYAFARRTRYGDHTVREASASILFHVGNQSCHSVLHGQHGPCYTKVTEAMTKAQRMGVCQWPAAGLLPSSTFEEFQAAFFANHQGCPAPCSLVMPSYYHGTCDGATWDVRYMSHSQASQLLFAKDVEADKGDCQDAAHGTDCFWGVKWLMNQGIHQSPQVWPELSQWPTFAEAQQALYVRDQHACKRPFASVTDSIMRMAKKI